jgi:hemerythrin-like domain-containing protein
LEIVMTTQIFAVSGSTRRGFLQVVASAAGLLFVDCASAVKAGSKAPSSEGEASEAEVTPGEDLMQEHGVLERILLIYAEAAARIERGAPVDLGIVASGAALVRRFVEEYHEKLEEEFVFPRLEGARREVELVATLRRQHQSGREVTEELLRQASSGGDPASIAAKLRVFERMYRPHAAREDTVLFPAFREVVGGAAYRELGEQFEHQEHARFGEHGFENAVAEVARLEGALGIGDLAQFTP